MMVFYISLAGINIKVKCNYKRTYRYVKSYIIEPEEYKEPFASIEVSHEDIKADINKNRMLLGDIYNHSQKHVYIPYYNELNFEAFSLHRKIAEIIPLYSTFLMHGAVVEKDGFAYMFTAPSGVGKSTRAKLWLKEYPDSIIVNGDKPLIKISDEEAIACGTPWCGKEGWNANRMVALRAILIVERAETGCTIEELNINQVFPFLLQQSYRPVDENAMKLTLQLLKALDGKVRFFRFKSAPTSEAIRIAYNTVCPK